MAPRKRKSRGTPLSSSIETNHGAVDQQLNMLGVSVLTDSMLSSFRSMARALTCPLCHRVVEQPQTLAACAHSFCMECIDEYACNNWQCPVDGCGQSIALRGNRKGKFRRTNPSLETIATSWKAIHGALMRAPPNWWKDEGSPDDTGGEEKKESEEDPLAALKPVAAAKRDGQESKDDDKEEEWIDLQRMGQSVGSTADRFNDFKHDLLDNIGQI